MSSQEAQIERKVTFLSRGQPALQLEGVLHQPMQAEDAAVFVLCHPQPASSTMDDSLDSELARHLAAEGQIALRFNFRGVGQSQGQQTDGRMEPLDVAGALDFALKQPGVNPEKVCVIGHGFGAYIAMLYAPFDQRIKTVVSISLPLFRVANGFPKQFERPKLFITGEFDELCPLYKLEPFVEQQKGPKGIKVITGARHLMKGYEEPAIKAILSYVNKWLQMPGI